MAFRLLDAQATGGGGPHQLASALGARRKRGERPPRRAAQRPLRFWDSSAVVPLLVGGATTESMRALATEDPLMLVWWATPVECVSAISRLERDGDLAASLEIVTLDDRLIDAARREGFVVRGGAAAAE